MTEPLSTEERERLAKLVSPVTRWLLQSGWLGSYEHARAEAEAFVIGIGHSTLSDALAAAGLVIVPSASLATQEADTRALRDAAESIRGLRITPDQIQAALRRLRGPCDRDEAYVMAAADAAARALAALTPKAEETPRG